MHILTLCLHRYSSDLKQLHAFIHERVLLYYIPGFNFWQYVAAKFKMNDQLDF